MAFDYQGAADIRGRSVSRLQITGYRSKSTARPQGTAMKNYRSQGTNQRVQLDHRVQQ